MGTRDSGIWSSVMLGSGVLGWLDLESWDGKIWVLGWWDLGSWNGEIWGPGVVGSVVLGW